MGKSVCWNNGDDGYEIDIKKGKNKGRGDTFEAK